MKARVYVMPKAGVLDPQGKAIGHALEGLGFAGVILGRGLLGVIVWRIWRTAQLSRDEYGMLVCVGVLSMVVFQVFENVGMTMGIMPVTGIPLPFVSYGGSAILTQSAALGLVLSVHMRRFV